MLAGLLIVATMAGAVAAVAAPAAGGPTGAALAGLVLAGMAGTGCPDPPGLALPGAGGASRDESASSQGRSSAVVPADVAGQALGAVPPHDTDAAPGPGIPREDVRDPGGEGDGTAPAGWTGAARAAWIAALHRGDELQLALWPQPVQRARLEWCIRWAGGSVLWQGQATGSLVARVPAASLPALLPLVDAIEVDGTAAVAAPDTSLAAPDAASPSLPFELALHRANQDALGAVRLRTTHGVDGSGVTVAVIDTGVDPGLPALQPVGAGGKIAAYVDFTSPVPFAQRVQRAREAGAAVVQDGRNPDWAAEGDVFLTATARAGGAVAGPAGTAIARVRWQGLDLQLPAAAAGQEVRLGWLDEANVGPGGTDLDGNGTVRDRWLVVAFTAQEQAGATATGEGADGGMLRADGPATSLPPGPPLSGTVPPSRGAAAPPAGDAATSLVVLVDADRDLDLAEEPALRPVGQGGGVTWLPRAEAGAPRRPGGPGGAGAGMALVVTAADPQGLLVNFGFDAHGHGTRMAAILAAAGSTYEGVAPGVQLLVLKALGSRGQGDWSQILAAVDYAVAHGADIVSLSAESPSPAEQLPVTERVLRQAMARGVLPVLAAGNGGPGLHTALPLPADAGLVVGAYLPEDAAQLLGDPAGARILPYSAVGPAVDGTPAPSLIGPGVTYTLVPAWQADRWPGGLAPDEGTSVAVPYVAGLAALLLEHGRRQAPALPAAALLPVLHATARPLAGAPATAQGYGTPDGLRAAGELAAWRVGTSGPAGAGGNAAAAAAGSSGGWRGTRWQVLWLHRGRPYKGIFWDGAPPGILNLVVRHGTGEPVTARWAGVPAWARFPGPMPYPAGDGLYLPVAYRLPDRPGLYDALVRLEGDAGPPVGFLQAFVRPYGLDTGYLRVQGSVGRGRVERVFVDVPPGTTQLVLSVERPAPAGAGDGGPSGRVTAGSLSAWVFAPGGRLVRDSAGDAGRLIGGSDLPVWTVEVPSPAPGVWEIDLFFSSLAPAAFDQAEAPYRVTVTARGIRWQPAELELDAPGAAGGRIWQPVTLVPFGRAVRGRVAGIGWAAPGAASGDAATATAAGAEVQPEERVQVNVLAGEPQPYRLDVPEGTTLLAVEVGPPPRSGWRPHLYLYRVEGGAAEPVGDGGGGSAVTVVGPAPGRYYAVVELERVGVPPAWEGGQVDGTDPGPVAIPLLVRRFQGDGAIRVPAGAVDLAAGQAARVVASVDVPAGTGEPRGYLVLLEDEGRVAALLPVRVRRGPPRLVVTAVVPPVGPGERAQITLQVRDRTDGMWRDASLIAGGRLYTTAGGQVTVPWDGRTGTLTVRVLGAAEESVQQVPLPAPLPGSASAQ